MDRFKKTLFLPMETKAREFDSKLLIAHKALEKGFSVVIGKKGEVYKLARVRGSGIFFYKDHTPMSTLMLEELKVAGLNIVNMDEEGLSWPSPEIYKKRIDNRVFQISDAVFAWGQKQYEQLTRFSPGHDEKIHIVGNPRFDILHRKYRPFLINQAKYNLSEFEEGYVLINSMFNSGNWNPLMYGTNSYVEHMQDRGLIKNDEDYKFYSKVSENDAKLFEVYVSLLKNLSKIFPNTRFIIRPHPDENHEKWRTLFRSIDNVEIKYSGSAVHWILGSKVLLFSGCTTAIEAWAMDKPTLRYDPLPETKYGPQLPNKFGKTIKTEQEVIKELRNILSSSNERRFNVDPDYVQSYIKNGFSANSAETIVNILDSLYMNNDYIRNESIFFLAELKKNIKLFLYFDIKKRWASRVFGKIKRIVAKTNIEKDSKIAQAKAQKFPDLKKEEIKIGLNSLDKIIDQSEDKKRKILKIANNTYEIKNVNS